MNNKKAGTAEKIRWSDLKESDEYTPRRLLVRNTIKEYSGEYEAEDWDIMDAKPDIDKSVINIKKKYEQATTTNKNENWRFIPNTGEYLLLDEITVDLNNKHGVRINEVYDGKYTIKSICARDRDYNKEKKSTNYGNIYNNKADVFKAAFFGENCKTRLSEINIERLYVDEKEQKITESAKKTENYQTDFYEGNNFAAKFKVSSNGKILPLANNATNIKLGIRPESAEKAFPGDDLILIFKISDGKSDYQIPVNTKDYIAVYDKKMLWRANLYIDEGTNDWNDIHPWNTADNTIGWYGTNSWLVSGTTVSGGQCKINTWTRFNDGETVTDSVAYGWGCWDSVEEFNNELIGQRTAIGQYRTEHPDSEYAALQWINTQTTAPGTGTGTVRWKNYLFPEIYEDSHNIIYYGNNLTEEQKASTTQFPYTIAENSPSVPGFSTYIHNDLGKYQKEIGGIWYISNTANLTSGADCSGLVSASMCHRTNGMSNYKAVPNPSGFSKMNTTAFADAENTYPIFAASKDEPWRIVLTSEQEKKSELKLEREKHQKLISHAVPGDILVKAGYHVVIIQNLNYPEDSEVLTDFNQVDVIHSCKGLLEEEALWNVMKSTFNEVDTQTNISSYQLRRVVLRSE